LISICITGKSANINFIGENLGQHFHHFLLIQHMIVINWLRFCIFGISPHFDLAVFQKSYHFWIRYKCAEFLIQYFKRLERFIKDSQQVIKVDIYKLLQIDNNMLEVGLQFNKMCFRIYNFPMKYLYQQVRMTFTESQWFNIHWFLWWIDHDDVCAKSWFTCQLHHRCFLRIWGVLLGQGR